MNAEQPPSAAQDLLQRRITVSNFDAVEQMRTWLALGAQDATSALLGALRTGLLLADTVVIDRNQLLDGVFFVAMTPDRMAWHLGLEPGAALPLVVDCEPIPEDDASRHTADVARSVAELQYQHVAGGPSNRVSSAFTALTGSYDRSTDQCPSVMEYEPGVEWHRSDPVLLSQAQWDRRDLEAIRSLIDRGRRAWVEAMSTGRVRLNEWNSVQPDLAPALKRMHDRLPEPQPLADALRDLRQRDDHGKLVVVTQRKLVVRWLDGEDRPELEPSQLDADLAEESWTDRQWALRWWNAAYVDAICAKNNLRMLTLRNPASSEVDAEQEHAWGLREESPSRVALAWQRLRRSRVPAAGTLHVEGEIVDNMMNISPERFSQLLHTQREARHSLWDKPTNRKMFDLALLVQESVGVATSRSRRMYIQTIRFAALAVIALTSPCVGRARSRATVWLSECCGLCLRSQPPSPGPTWACCGVCGPIACGRPYD